MVIVESKTLSVNTTRKYTLAVECSLKSTDIFSLCRVNIGIPRIKIDNRMQNLVTVEEK